MTEADRLHARISGRVQGVGFRWFVREEARRLGLAGWVKNLPNGDLELVAEGPPGTLEGFAKTIAKGPPGARVELVHRLPTAAGIDTLPSPFAIER